MLDYYVTSEPHPQNAVDIFRDQWSSVLPGILDAESGGHVRLFDDPRVAWFADTIGGVAEKTILELGPLEGGHTWMLEQRGAASILAIEANTRAYLRCLVVKELCQLRHARFVCGDFLEYLRRRDEMFQVGVACGVLYHMQNPAELVALLARHCSEHLFVWTHYYDAALVSGNRPVGERFSGSAAQEYDGFAHTLYRQEYQKTLDWSGFCGAGAPASYWMTREDLFRCLAHFGFEVEAIGFDDPGHPNGPAIAVAAKRARSSPPGSAGL